jgi:hypothetical protein
MANRLARRSFLLLLVLLVLSGCGSDGPEVMKVSGTVTREGKGIDKLVVNFWPENGRPSWGLTDTEGHYTLKYDKDRDGAVPGKHKVWVQVKPTSPKEEADMANGLWQRHPQIISIIEKYGNQKTSPLIVEIKENNQVVDLPLD